MCHLIQGRLDEFDTVITVTVPGLCARRMRIVDIPMSHRFGEFCRWRGVITCVSDDDIQLLKFPRPRSLSTNYYSVYAVFICYISGARAMPSGATTIPNRNVAPVISSRRPQ